MGAGASVSIPELLTKQQVVEIVGVENFNDTIFQSIANSDGLVTAEQIKSEINNHINSNPTLTFKMASKIVKVVYTTKSEFVEQVNSTIQYKIIASIIHHSYLIKLFCINRLIIC